MRSREDAPHSLGKCSLITHEDDPASLNVQIGLGVSARVRYLRRSRHRYEFLVWIMTALIPIQTRIGSCGPFELPWEYAEDADNPEPSDKYALVVPQVLRCRFQNSGSQYLVQN